MGLEEPGQILPQHSIVASYLDVDKIEANNFFAPIYDTASIVKAQILACMLLKAQDAGRRPTAAEMKLARPMIRLSISTGQLTSPKVRLLPPLLAKWVNNRTFGGTSRPVR